MPFGLISARATFQGAMETTFRGLLKKSVVVYFDAITFYSKIRRDHLQHLTQSFERCRKYGIYLTPQKSIFTVSKGRLPRHAISKYGIIIDPKSVRSISWIDLP